jgi:hypothetical protein
MKISDNDRELQEPKGRKLIKFKERPSRALLNLGAGKNEIPLKFTGRCPRSRSMQSGIGRARIACHPGKSVRPKCGTTSDTSVTAVELYARAVGRGTLTTHSPTKQGSAAEPSGGE